MPVVGHTNPIALQKRLKQCVLGFIRTLFLAVILLAGVEVCSVENPQSRQVVHKVALLLANQTYHDPQLALDNPLNDSALMSQKLTELGFTTWHIEDFTKAEFYRQFNRLLIELQQFRDANADVVFTLFYAGHGIQLNRTNYLVPVDSTLMQQASISDKDIQRDFISLTEITERLQQLDNLVNIVILDACRNLPFAELDNQIGGWTDIVLTDFFVAFGSGPGEQVFDGTGQKNSVFVEAIARHIATPNLTLGQMFQRVRRDVMAATDNSQIPQESSRAIYDFGFNQLPSQSLSQSSQLSSEFNSVYGWAAMTLMLFAVGIILLFKTNKLGGVPAYWFPVFGKLTLFSALLPFYFGIQAYLAIDTTWYKSPESPTNLVDNRDTNNLEEQGAFIASQPKTAALPEVWHHMTQANEGERSLTRIKEVENKVVNPSIGLGSQGKISSLAEEIKATSSASLNTQTAANTDVFIAQDYVSRILDQMVRFESGHFKIGSNHFGPASKPVVDVFVAPFRMLNHEMTNALMRVCVEQGACELQLPIPAQDLRPVTNISFEQITEHYIPWLNSLSNIQFRLPTEVEWEYAAGYLASDPFNEALIQGTVTANCIDCRGKSFGLRSAPVKTYSANQAGMYDMLGNVSEWTQSCWRDNYQQQYYGAPWEGAGDCEKRVIRGGAWHHAKTEISIHWRRAMASQRKSSSIGFRLVTN